MQTIRALIDHHAKTSPDAIFLICPDEDIEISYQALQKAVMAQASALSAYDIKPGDVVSLMMANSWASIQTILSILYYGGIVAPLNLVAGDQQLAYMIAHSETKLILTDADKQERLQSILVQSSHQPPHLTALESNSNVALSLAPSPQDDGLLMYTSGTTGKPKGVLLTQQSLIAGGENVVEAHKITAKDRGLCVLPLYHINAFCVSLMATLVAGSTLVLPHRFSVQQFWPLMIEKRCTWFSVVPTQVQYLLHQAETAGPPSPIELAHIRLGRSASAPLSPDVHKRFEEMFGLCLIETMGLTECAAQILSNPLHEGGVRHGSPGQAVGNKVCIIDDAGTPQPANTPGEVAVRGKNIFRAYLKNPEATQETFTADGWFKTGDLGVMDKEGYFWITGRKKELIIKGGENIAPREIDEALLEHPEIVEAAAFAQPCQRYGQRVEACVVLTPESPLQPADLIAFCQQQVGTFKAPDQIYCVDDLPRGPSGKIQRLKLAELYQSSS